MTETNGSVCVASGAVLIDKPLTCGQPLPTVDLKIVREDGSEAWRSEVGEIFVRGAMVMKEYCNWPEATARTLRDGWLRSGDLGRLDEENYLEIVDRLTNISEYDGVWVSHSEIERLVVGGALAREAVALRVEDKAAGTTKLMLVVVPGQGKMCDSNRIAERLLAAGVTGKVRPEIVTVESLPITASGKVDNRELRQWILAGTV
jgi:acyl-CoA synthetase (AMP-forming)/AMP-acid ligase II